MRIARVLYGYESFYAELRGDHYIRIHSPFGEIIYEDKEYLKSLVKALPPANPSKIVCVGLNYRDHAREMKDEIPSEPRLFLKPPSALLAHGQPIIHPPQSKRVDYEAELAVVIGCLCKNVSVEDAGDYILGYTCANDVTARDLQSKDVQWTRAKSFDTFCPLGPDIVTDLDVSRLSIKTTLNGNAVQKGNTADMIFSVPEIISYISGVMTLYPGDVVLTGTPSGIGSMNIGDTVAVEIEGIGRLENTVGL